MDAETGLRACLAHSHQRGNVNNNNAVCSLSGTVAVSVDLPTYLWENGVHVVFFVGKLCVVVFL